MTGKADPDSRIEEIEMALLLEAIQLYYGYDFREYAPASLKRRIHKYLEMAHLTTISALQDHVLHNPGHMQQLLDVISVDVSAIFRDPTFYLAFRQKVCPWLRGLPFVRIWHAGCAAGEEIYSMAILLVEEGLSEKTRIYATDLNTSLLNKAQAGIFPIKRMQSYTENYQRAGGKRTFSEYYTARYGNAIFNPELKQNVLWAQHNLATDASFNEFQVIVCRNVMIYFNQGLQGRVHNLIYNSLCPQGVLALGKKEMLNNTPHGNDYEVLDHEEKLYRKS